MRIPFVIAALGTPALVASCAEAEELAPARSTAVTSSVFAVTPGTGGASATVTNGATSVDGSGGMSGMSVAGSGGGGGASPGFDASTADASFDSTPALDAGHPLRDIVLLYKCTDTNPADSQIGPSYRLVEMGLSTVNLSDFKIRYYITNEAKVALLSDYLYAEVNGGPGYRDIRSYASVAFSSLTPPRPGADAYVDISFATAAGTLTRGQTCTVNFVVHTPGFAATLNESDDYSHDLSKTDFSPNDKVALYYKDQLVLGAEP